MKRKEKIQVKHGLITFENIFVQGLLIYQNAYYNNVIYLFIFIFTYTNTVSQFVFLKQDRKNDIV